MLSAETIARLEQLCDDSHAVFSEGGVFYSFVDSAVEVKSRISNPLAHLRDLDHSAHATNATLTAEDLAAFSRFLFCARGHGHEPSAVTPEEALEEAGGEARDWIRQLHDDLRFDAVWWETVLDDGWSFDGVLYMMRRSDHRYFALELNWTID